MKITIAAATKFELNKELLQHELHNIQFLYTGASILLSAVNLTQHVLQQKPDLVIQAGIAGSFHNKFLLGDIVAVERDCVGDTGVWEHHVWNDLFDLNLLKPDDFPFQKKSLVNDRIDHWNVLNLPVVTGVTVNEITTDANKCNAMITKYNADIETMEGASLHYVCRLFDIPFIQIRGISNYIGERDKSRWKMKEAVTKVNEAVQKMLIAFADR